MTEIIGYQNGHPVLKSRTGSIVTHAFILCDICNTVISSNSGPLAGTICPPCYRKTNMSEKEETKNTLDKIDSATRMAMTSDLETEIKEKDSKKINESKLLTEVIPDGKASDLL